MRRPRRWIFGPILLVAAGALTTPALGVHARAASTPAKTPLAGDADAGRLGRAASAVGCRGAALRGSFTEAPGSLAMGAVEYTLRLRNTSSQPCTVAGRPSLQLLDGGGKPLPTDEKPWQPSRAASAAFTPRVGVEQQRDHLSSTIPTAGATTLKRSSAESVGL
jgi:Protein of unknown function (DUF4232)